MYSVYNNIYYDNIKFFLKPNSLIKTISLNFGPQHPAAHGVLRLVLKLNGEVVKKCDPHIGLLHRGTEKLIENKTFLQSLPYFDRLDYVSTLAQENVYCMAIDKLCGLKKQAATLITRTVFDELTRILNHLLAISCHALDVGSMSTIFWSFEEREKIMEFYERVSGARFHTTLYRPIFSNILIEKQLRIDILNFSQNCFISLNEMHNVLTNNKVWRTRLVNIGIYSYNSVMLYGLSGVMARCVGMKLDIRCNINTSYNNYKYINFYSYTTINGDCYDRYLLRMYEMVEAINIIIQSILKLKVIIFLGTNTKYYNVLYKNTMESLITHFKYWSVGMNINSNIITVHIESPKGTLSVNLFTDNSDKPYRCKIRSPSLHHLQFLKKLSKNVFLADIVTLIGTIDIVFGEIDR